MKKYEVVCDGCGKKNSFGDTKDITYAKWRVISWTLPSGNPRCICSTCEYFPRKKKHEDDEVEKEKE